MDVARGVLAIVADVGVTGGLDGVRQGRGSPARQSGFVREGVSKDQKAAFSTTFFGVVARALNAVYTEEVYVKGI